MNIPNSQTPLANLIRELRRVDSVMRSDIAKKFEKRNTRRIDFWLYRRLIPNNDLGILVVRDNDFYFTEKVEVRNILLQIQYGLSCKNKHIRTSCYAVLCKVRRHFWLKLLNDSPDKKLAKSILRSIYQKLRDFTNYDSLEVNALEKKILSLIGGWKAIEISSVIYNTSSYSQKDDVSKLLKKYETLYKQLNSISRDIGLKEKGKMVFDKPLEFSLLLIEKVRELRLKSSSNCIPWHHDDYLLTLGFIFSNYSNERKKINVSQLDLQDYEKIRQLLFHVQKLQKMSWSFLLTYRRKAIQARNSDEYSDTSVSIDWLDSVEQDRLSEFARTEWVIGNYMNSAVSSATLLFRLLNTPSNLKPWILKKHTAQAMSLGIQVPNKKLAYGLYSVKLTTNVISISDMFFPSIIEEQSLEDWYVWNKPKLIVYHTRLKELLGKNCNIQSLIYLLNTLAKPNAFKKIEVHESDRLMFFEIALTFSMVKQASFIAVAFGRPILKLNKQLIFKFLELVSSIYTMVFPYIDHDEHNLYRGMVLRKLWKTCEDNFSDQETLRIHEFHQGEFDIAMDKYPFDQTILWKLYKDNLCYQSTDSYYEFLSKTIPKSLRLARPTPINIQGVNIDTTIVSISIRDGHRLSCVIISKAKITSFELSTQSEDETDWSELVEDISFNQLTWSRDSFVPWDKAFHGLAYEIIKAVKVLNKDTKYIALATSSIFRKIPWQNLFSVVYKQRWLVEHISGVASYVLRDESIINSIESTKIFHDDNDPVYHKIKDSIKENRVSWSDSDYPALINSVATVFTQGSRGYKGAQILFENKEVSTTELIDELSGYALTIFHSCHAGYIEESNYGDLGGIPGLLINHGSSMVVASSGFVTPEQAEIFDNYFTYWLKEKKLSFHEMFLNAVYENPHLSFYNIFGCSQSLDRLKKQYT